MIRATVIAGALGGAVGAVLAAGILVAQAQSAASAIGIDNFTFNPQQLTVKAGATVTWTNKDDIPHAVAATDRSFKSKTLDTGDSYAVTFTTPGTFQYFCSLHPHMTGTIVVEAAH
jgi:plastocyanin